LWHETAHRPCPLRGQFLAGDLDGKPLLDGEGGDRNRGAHQQVESIEEAGDAVKQRVPLRPQGMSAATSASEG
jgi:hypothetical protein